MRASSIELPQGLDRTTVLKQINDLEDQLTKLEYLRLQLNGQLQQLMDCPLNEHCFFWPEMDWNPNLNPLAADLELAVGLESRPDLRGLAIVLCNFEKVTLPIARAVLHYADSTVGSVEPRSGVVHALRCFRCNEHEVPVRCHQLAMFYEDTEAKATGEIKNAVYKIALQQHRVVIAQQTVFDLRDRLDELTKTRDVDDVAVFQLSTVRLELDQAESALIEQVVTLKIAEVELKQAQGVLASECGFVPKLCLEGCCNGACLRCEGELGGGSCQNCRSGSHAGKSTSNSSTANRCE